MEEILFSLDGLDMLCFQLQKLVTCSEHSAYLVTPGLRRLIMATGSFTVSMTQEVKSNHCGPLNLLWGEADEWATKVKQKCSWHIDMGNTVDRLGLNSRLHVT